MKRRSARPFMVEVKHTRTARASLTAAKPRTGPDKDLWPELIEAEAKPAQPDHQAALAPRPEERVAEAPVRRVLPSLVPMFQIPAEPDVEPEAEPEPETAAIPRVRRPRARSGRAPAVAPAAVGAAPAESAAEPRRAVARPEPVAQEPAVQPSPAAPGHAPSPRPAAPWRRANELRLGERWKRRLPQFLR
jgi:hypothetical protein